ncbi:class D beta-lactamase [Chitinophaga sedimenti]|uniref:penicillin-binding transpeptidase domain-containing protein n=1 Tax=Chitinophaga sedimenti TaxID=2033606 RepID=UPI002004D09A|nr:penicillin-binding transpeptidase domain-containing protein [Chitinophaga sedimenti]MCK7558825.1 class D beta-lactamase [Chitinophaga sedimenti]
MEGTFMLFDNGRGNFKVYNIKRARQAYLPASTFKICNSLVALQTGVIADTNVVIKWDSIVRPIAAWNHDLNMQQAFRASSVPYFREVARRIGRDTMQHWLDTLKYGNMKISKIDTFWLDNSLKITPDEELGFVKKLYFDQLPFNKRTQELVRSMMLMENTPKYKLAYKTGWGLDGAKQIAWIVGWIEKEGLPSFFCLNFETEDDKMDIPAVRMDILKKISSRKNFFKHHIGRKPGKNPGLFCAAQRSIR